MSEVSMSAPRVYYLVPDYAEPSWGIALLYRHVEILRRHGFEAFILHHHHGFSLNWLESHPPTLFLDESTLSIQEQDFLVVPEVLAKEATELPFGCRRIVFVQGAFLILKPFNRGISYREEGYEAAVAILPHVKEILERHFDIEAQVVPPFVAEYFFAQSGEEERERRILLFPKDAYREAGYHDWEIFRKLLGRMGGHLRGWEVQEVRDLPHRDLARLMKQSIFMVNLNCLEAFNTTVPEAMAAGCIPICYEAYGGRDFLENGVNAFVFPNNDIYSLAARLKELTAGYSETSPMLTRMREMARQTASRYREARTEGALLDFFSSHGLVGGLNS